MAVELGRTLCVRHGHLRFARLFRQKRRSTNAWSGCSCAEAGAPHEPRYAAVSVCVEETAPTGGWIRRRRRRRATGRRRAGKRWIDISLKEIFVVIQISTASCVEHFVQWDGGEGEPIGIERQREQVRRSGPSKLRR